MACDTREIFTFATELQLVCSSLSPCNPSLRMKTLISYQFKYNLLCESSLKLYA